MRVGRVAEIGRKAGMKLLLGRPEVMPAVTEGRTRVDLEVPGRAGHGARARDEHAPGTYLAAFHWWFRGDSRRVGGGRAAS